MGTCPKCGKKIKRKRKSDNVRWCRRHGLIEKTINQKLVIKTGITLNSFADLPKLLTA